MTTAVIVQARMGSTRLPGKVLMPIAGHTVLEEVLGRCRAIPGADIVVCAIPETGADDALIAPAARAGARVVRGSTQDVLARYHKAARAVDATVVMRVTSDCPLIDPALCGEVLALRVERGVDFACNDMPPLFPHGLDCEVFTRDTLERANASARDPYQREHVTPWMRDSTDVSRAALLGPGGAAAEQRWTLDHPEDLAFLAAVFVRLPKTARFPSWQETMAVVAAEPELARINAERRVVRT